MFHYTAGGICALQPEYRLTLQMMLCQYTLKFQTVRRQRLHQDQFLFRDLFQADAFLLCKRVICVGDNYNGDFDLVPDQPFAARERIVDDAGCVQLPVSQPLDQHAGRVQRNLQLDLGKASVIGDKRVLQQELRKRIGHAKAHCAAENILGLEHVLHPDGDGAELLGIGQKLLAKLRQRDTPPDPVEKRTSDLLLQLLDLGADIGLGVAEFFCRVRKILQGRDLQKRIEISDFHALTLLLVFSSYPTMSARKIQSVFLIVPIKSICFSF